MTGWQRALLPASAAAAQPSGFERSRVAEEVQRTEVGWSMRQVAELAVNNTQLGKGDTRPGAAKVLREE